MMYTKTKIIVSNKNEDNIVIKIIVSFFLSYYLLYSHYYVSLFTVYPL